LIGACAGLRTRGLLLRVLAERYFELVYLVLVSALIEKFAEGVPSRVRQHPAQRGLDRRGVSFRAHRQMSEIRIFFARFDRS
jgi:hypothetical protein